MLSAQLNRVPHRRLNPLTGDWVLVSAHRLERPWQGRVEPAPAQETRRYDPDCYLCPGNARAGGARNPQYGGTFVFDNDYPALLPPAEALEKNERDLIVARSEPGVCRVVCFSPRHDLTLARMSPAELLRVVEVWTEQYCSLGAEPWLQHVQIFENRGVIMGASNPHPHCQIWATQHLPNQPQRELEMQTSYRQQHGSCLLCDCLALEEKAAERVVCRNQWFTALVPFWAVWPFETLVIARR